MSVALGKRKRTVKIAAPPAKKKSIATPPLPPAAAEPESDGEDKEALQEAFRRAFEARFKPIEEEKPKTGAQTELEDAQDAELEDEEEDDDDDWDGISEDEEDGVEVVEHTTTAKRERADKALLKAFMVRFPPFPPSGTRKTNTILAFQTSKPPTSDTAPTKPSSSSKTPPTSTNDPDPDTNEASDLKNDLALQRLLKESHLLDANFASTDPTGKNRHKATDLRLLDLGGKTSIFAQKNMPRSHRVGIAKKKEDRERERRKEAKENGVVLERVRREEVNGGAERRERGVGAPAVGRFSGGTLRLSKRDVEGITGPKSSGRGGKGGRGRGGKRR